MASSPPALLTFEEALAQEGAFKDKNGWPKGSQLPVTVPNLPRLTDRQWQRILGH